MKYWFVEGQFRKGRYVVVGFGRSLASALRCFADLRGQP